VCVPDGVLAAITGIAFGVIATSWVVVTSSVARARRRDAWPMMRRSMPGIVLFGATSLVLMWSMRFFHADPVTMDHLAKVCAILVPIVAIFLTVRAHRRA
jgi:hypothetical protein